MENHHHILALAGSARSGKHTLLSKLTSPRPSRWLKSKNTYEYSGENYLLTDMEGSSFPGLESVEAVILVCDALCLEQGLHQLKELLTVEQIQEQSLPLILCINFWDKAERRGIFIDTELLQDVLQIPVVPCCSHNRELLDDVKAAIHYSLRPSHKKEFYYHCLDFSPGRLARGCMSYTDTFFTIFQLFF